MLTSGKSARLETSTERPSQVSGVFRARADHRRLLLLFLIALMIISAGWYVPVNIRMNQTPIAVLQSVLFAFGCWLFYSTWRNPYARWRAVLFLVPMFSVMVFAMSFPTSSMSVFVWVFIMPVLSYFLAGRSLGFPIAFVFVAAAFAVHLVRLGPDSEVFSTINISNVGIALLTIWLVTHLYEQNRQVVTRKLELLATTDSLTQLYNRRQLDEVFPRVVAPAERHDSLLALLVMDLDMFKQINDTWGHDAGDTVLTHVASLMRDNVRASDWIFRTGGEEFCILLPDTNRSGAQTVAESIRQAITDTPCSFKGVTIDLSASIGIAVYPTDGEGLAHLFSIADSRMYTAKQRGRNQVVSYPG